MNRLKELRTERGLTQKDVAEHLGLDRTTYVKYERGVTEPSIDSLNKLANLFGVTVDCLFGREPSRAPKLKGTLASVVGAYPLSNVSRIPIVGEVRAGFNLLAQDEFEGYIEVPDTSPEEHFAFKIVGDSMEPRFCSGDIAIVHVQPVAESGDIVIAVYDGECGTMKRFRETPNAVLLESLNDAYAPMVFPKDSQEITELRIIGRVVKVIVQL